MNLFKATSLAVFLTATALANFQTTSPSKTALSQLQDNLSNEALDQAILGKSFFSIPWVEAPSATTARDGLGPLFNANTCTSCHPNNAYTPLFNENKTLSRGVVARLSIPNSGSKVHEQYLQTRGFVPHEVYGSQLSLNGTQNVPFEGRIEVEYKQKEVKYPDGHSVFLRVPTYTLVDLNYGNISKDTIVSVRKAPALVGLGLIEQLDEASILAHVDENDSNNDGISGRANYVYDIEKNEIALGKYTYKAAAPTLKQQIATAFHNDMSLTTSLFPQDNCSQHQKECLNAKKAQDAIDVPDHRLDAIASYLSALKVPVNKQKNKEGEKLFSQIGCASCHVPNLKTKKGFDVPVYSDFLLHDMGEDLSDGKTEFRAQTREWRTTPLWGINSYFYTVGQTPEFLHDGRARNIEEAILWHGGEAQKSKEAFMHLSKQQRSALIEFIGAL
jgi:CxxC motif-containing protein (DUF1111 family)